jgi:TRAP-type C4-dicarboxylate transport system substrate-binding protein
MIRAAVALSCFASLAHADPVTLRLATVAPDGSGWAREFRGFSHDVEQHTAGRVRLKWYFNAVAGDEDEMAERIGHGQLDGMASGGMVCQKAAPSMGILRVPGLFTTRQEANHVMYSLQSTFETEARERGWLFLANAPLGTEVLLAKRPVRSVSELKSLRIWRWKADEMSQVFDRAMGETVVPSDIGEAARLVDDGKVDAMWVIPTAAVVWEWTLRAPYVLDLHSAYLFGCVLLTSHALARVSPEDRKEIVGAAARLVARFEEVTIRTEKALFGGALAHQGVQMMAPSEAFRAEFFGDAVEARKRIGHKLLSAALIERVVGLLADFRAEHGR